FPLFLAPSAAASQAIVAPPTTVVDSRVSAAEQRRSEAETTAKAWGAAGLNQPADLVLLGQPGAINPLGLAELFSPPRPISRSSGCAVWQPTVDLTRSDR